MSKRKYKFFNIPRKFEIKDYERSTGKIIDKYKDIKGLKAIYDWGNPSQPGISDIDLVFVFDSGVEEMPMLTRSFNFLDSDSRYLVRHPFVFIDEKTFSDVKYIYPKTNFNLIYGDSVKIKSLSKENQVKCNVALMNDLIIRHYPRDFLYQKVKKKINVRDTLLRLNSLKYTVKILNEFGLKNNEWDHKIKLISKLREGWFADKDYELLVHLNSKIVYDIMDMIESYNSFLRKSYVNVKSGFVKYNGVKNLSVFVKNWDKDKALTKMIEDLKADKVFRSILPIELSPHLIEYSRHIGLISNFVKGNIRGQVEYETKLSKILEMRIKILNNQANLARVLKHSDFVAYYDFGYRNKTGLNNFVLNLIRK